MINKVHNCRKSKREFRFIIILSNLKICPGSFMVYCHLFDVFLPLQTIIFVRSYLNYYLKIIFLHGQKKKWKMPWLSSFKGAWCLTWSGMAIRSPLISVSTLLSSMTEFIDSIHSVSTGASNRIHFSSGRSSYKKHIGNNKDRSNESTKAEQQR